MAILPKKFKNLLKRFFLINDTPHKIAAGAALGVFLGIIPGEGILSTLFFAWIFRLNRLAALAGVAITNMWTTILLLPLAAVLGGFLFQVETSELIRNFQNNYTLGWRFFFNKIFFFDLLLPLVVGILLVAFIVAMIFYCLIYFSLKRGKISWK